MRVFGRAVLRQTKGDCLTGGFSGKERRGESPLGVTGPVGEVFDRADGLSFGSGDLHGHVKVCFVEAIYTGKHLPSPIPKTFQNGRFKERSSRRPMAIRVSSQTNPALLEYLEQEFLASLAFNSDPLSMPRVGVLNSFRGQSKLLRVSNERADVILRHVDKIS